MNTAAQQTIFHPYKVIQQGRSVLQLQPPPGKKFVLFLLWFIPLIMLTVGVVLFLIQKETLFLYTFGGIGILEAILFSFIKVPASLSMDSIGFTLETFSLKGRNETYYLWNDVEFISYRKVSSKGGPSLLYDAILKTGKKISFLSFGNYHSKKNQLTELNSTLQQISNKEIREN